MPRISFTDGRLNFSFAERFVFSSRNRMFQHEENGRVLVIRVPIPKLDDDSKRAIVRAHESNIRRVVKKKSNVIVFRAAAVPRTASLAAAIEDC
jgi:hypothetical protein